MRSVESWVETLTDAGIPACPVNDLGRAIEAPISSERQVLVGDDGEKFPWLRLPIDRGRTAQYRPTPKLGEHTREVLREAGLTDEEINGLGPQPS